MLVVCLILILPKFFCFFLCNNHNCNKDTHVCTFFSKIYTFFSCLIFHAMKSQFRFQVAFHTHHIASFICCVDFFFHLRSQATYCCLAAILPRILEINQRNSRHDALVLMPFRCYCNEYKTSSAVAAVAAVSPLQWGAKKVKIAKASFVFTWEAFMPTFHSIYFYEWPSRDTQTLA